jgi:hypothetical protein
MSTSPLTTIRRCQHIKVNGIQCGSPALRNERRCYFHEQCLVMSREIDLKVLEPGLAQIASLEDANSIQLGLAEVMRLLVMQRIDHRTASLLLRALRIAAANVKFTSFEPKQPTQVVVDPKSVENRPLGATAWSIVEGREYDIIEETNEAGTNKAGTNKAGNGAAEKHPSSEAQNCEADLMRLTEGLIYDPKLERPVTEAEIQSNPPLPDCEREYRQRRNQENWR